MAKNYPLIIVFYLDAEMMKMQEIITPFVEAINNMLHKKEANALAFFLPTTGEERIECINPTVVKEADMAKINAMVEDIKFNFAIGEDLDLNIADIEIPAPCGCGLNDEGICKC